MGRPKKGTKKAPDPSPDVRLAIIHLKGTPEYSQWLEAAHRKTHIAKASIVRLAIAEWAERNGLPAPPEM